jgi:hypothetical protein
MGIELLGCRPHWTSPLCEIGFSGRSVNQMTTPREQALGEGNCGRSNDRGKEACECYDSRARGFASEELMPRSCSSSLNRPVPTRMLGGVGRVPATGILTRFLRSTNVRHPPESGQSTEAEEYEVISDFRFRFVRCS